MAVSIKTQAKTVIHVSKNGIHYRLDSVLRKEVLKIYNLIFKIGLVLRIAFAKTAKKCQKYKLCT